jgi:hypothetical protein
MDNKLKKLIVALALLNKELKALNKTLALLPTENVSAKAPSVIAALTF